ncbi:SulP family inorganic anion transporter [cf. Phormidesmis sp. LEGE 11477]|uniref:bicarbonate transporter BicA n=1 Tax=cf. Phormidesmis sp. LEGE 11477 TaxID=1828680 RepID=UPI0018815AD7|nr:SulP family inorganic anion transporter [cf. Phormidesmis sp. LEGE 11477]MBE9059663.1 SulP family inorganic anion transporter [cf. Phormidesmis sp. LEGE 11477]
MQRAYKLTNQINFKNVRGDLFGGLTAAVIALPMALAFGVASGAGPTAGLYGAIIVGFFAALFGGTPTLISEPTGPMTVVITGVIASLVATNPENGMAMAFTVVIMAGVFQILLGVLKLGKYVTLMPYNVISGFMSGIGLILIILQIMPALGLRVLGEESPPSGVLGTLQALPGLIGGTHWRDAVLTLLTVLIILFFPKGLRKFAPPQLVAMIIGTILSLTFLSGDVDMARIGEIPLALPTLTVPTFSGAQMREMLVDAGVLGTLGCIDALLTSVVADSLTRTEHDSNKELVGQGIGNIASGLLGGLPGAGATMGTVVNIKAGGRTALSGLSRAAILLVVVLGASTLTENIPLSVLAGIIIKVGIDIIDWGFLKRAHYISRKSAAIMYGVIFLTVFVDLVVAVGVGVFVANMLTIEKLSMLRSDKGVTAVTDDDDTIALSAEEKLLLDKGKGRILLFSLSGPMIFGVAKAISRERAAMQNCQALVLDISEVPHLGVTTSLALENSIQEAVEGDRTVYIVGAKGQTYKRLTRLGLLDIVPADQFLPSRAEALKQALSAINQRGQQQDSDVVRPQPIA